MQSPLEITSHPLDMSVFGRSPGGLPLYRVVWADSRVTKLLYEGRVHEMPFYGPDTVTAGHWILERWLSPEKYIGMTREQFEQFVVSQRLPDGSLPPTEEWPSLGEYELAHVFTDHVSMEEVREAIAKTEYELANFTPAMRAQAIAQRFEDKRKAKKARKGYKLDEIMGRNSPNPEKNAVYSLPEVVNG